MNQHILKILNGLENVREALFWHDAEQFEVGGQTAKAAVNEAIAYLREQLEAAS